MHKHKDTSNMPCSRLLITEAQVQTVPGADVTARRCLPTTQAKRVKQVLSANSEAPLSVEELHNGVDFRSRIMRYALPCHCCVVPNVCCVPAPHEVLH